MISCSEQTNILTTIKLKLKRNNQSTIILNIKLPGLQTHDYLKIQFYTYLKTQFYTYYSIYFSQTKQT